MFSSPPADDEAPLMGDRGGERVRLDPQNQSCCDCLERKTGRGINNDAFSTVLLLLNTIVGSGILVQPYFFFQSGIISGIAIYILLGTLTQVGIVLLIYTADAVKIFDYAALAIEAFGPGGDLWVDLAIVIGSGGAILSYYLIIGSLCRDVIATYRDLSANGEENSWYVSEWFLIASAAVFTVPLVAIRNFGHLSFIAFISLTAISGTILLVLVEGPIEAPTHASDAINLAAGSGSLRTIGSVVLAFSYASCLFHAHEAAAPACRSPSTFSTIALCATMLGVLMCFLIGIAGYLSFRDDTQVDILENFTGTLGAVFKLVVVLHLLFFVPGEFVVLRRSFLSALVRTPVHTLSVGPYLVLTLFLLALLAGTACLISAYAGGAGANLSLVLDVTGGVGGCLTSFILPSAMALLLLPRRKLAADVQVGVEVQEGQGEGAETGAGGYPRIRVEVEDGTAGGPRHRNKTSAEEKKEKAEEKEDQKEYGDGVESNGQGLGAGQGQGQGWEKVDEVEWLLGWAMVLLVFGLSIPIVVIASSIYNYVT